MSSSPVGGAEQESEMERQRRGFTEGQTERELLKGVGVIYERDGEETIE